jgi:serine/threonine-protein kinase HipA
MKYCPITYEEVNNNETYSLRGLRLLSPQLKTLHPLELTAAEQRIEAINAMTKMSIQGIQPKLSAKLNIKEGHFELIEQSGQYILKPQSEYYPELPENEAVTMSLASIIGIEVPIHGLIYSSDKSLTYFIKRFDRAPYHKKLNVEDFSQLSLLSRETKYNSSLERVAEIITHSGVCSFPKIESIKLFKLILFSFLVGNEDMHLKNLSLITRDQKVELSPAYDLLNSTIAQKNSKEEMALPLNGKKNNLNKRDFFDYFAVQRLQLNQNIIEKIIKEINQALPLWQTLIHHSFLSAPMKEKYLTLLKLRCEKLDFI